MTIQLTDNPFAFLKELDWNDLADSSRDYTMLDDIYRILTDGYDERNVYDKRVLAMSIEEMKLYYSKHLAIEIGRYLEALGRELQERPEELVTVDYNAN